MAIGNIAQRQRESCEGSTCAANTPNVCVFEFFVILRVVGGHLARHVAPLLNRSRCGWRRKPNTPSVSSRRCSFAINARHRPRGSVKPLVSYSRDSFARSVIVEYRRLTIDNSISLMCIDCIAIFFSCVRYFSVNDLINKYLEFFRLCCRIIHLRYDTATVIVLLCICIYIYI